MQDLREIRRRITQIDEEISRLFSERLEISGDVAAHKRAMGKAVYDGTREQENIVAASKRAPEGFASYAAALQAVLMVASREVQHRDLGLHRSIANDTLGPSDASRISLVATVPTAPGSPCPILTCCLGLGVDLIKLEQVQAQQDGSTRTYVMTIERTGNQKLQALVDSLGDVCTELQLLDAATQEV